MISLVRKLWNSPSATSWINQLAQALRLIALTPILLGQFDEVEIAAWYLFASLMFFSEIVNSRVDLTFSRMIAMGMGGASSLAPLKGKNLKKKKAQDSPNWKAIERAYGTIGILNAGLVIFAALSALLLGLYALKNLTVSANNPEEIWLAFFIFLAVKLCTDLFRRYNVMLIGMGYVALNARWSSAFSVMSTLVGVAVLYFGGNIWQLALAMQSLILLNVFRVRYLVNHLEGGVVSRFKGRRFDKEVFDWAFEPFWKGGLLTLANYGALQFASVLFTRHNDPGTVASYLFTLRMLDTGKRLSSVPFYSQGPAMSKKMSQGEISFLGSMIPKRIALCTSLFALGSVALMFVGPLLLGLIESNADLMDPQQMIILCVAMLINQYILYSSYVTAMVNDIVCFKSILASGLMSFILLPVLIPTMGFLGMMIACFVPQILLVNIRPSLIAAQRLDLVPSKFFLRTGAVSAMLMVVSVVVVIMFAS